RERQRAGQLCGPDQLDRAAHHRRPALLRAEDSGLWRSGLLDVLAALGPVARESLAAGGTGDADEPAGASAMSAHRAGVAVLATLLLVGSAAAEPVDPGLQSRVEGLLGAYRAITVAEWKAVGPEAAPVLEAVARDAGALPTRRARALAALGVLRPSAAAPLVR